MDKTKEYWGIYMSIYWSLLVIITSEYHSTEGRGLSEYSRYLSNEYMYNGFIWTCRGEFNSQVNKMQLQVTFFDILYHIVFN
jgi:hypothetical protein